MVKDYLIVRETQEGKVMVPTSCADPEEAVRMAHVLCDTSKQVVKVYELMGVARTKKVLPVQFDHVTTKGRR